MITKPMKFTLMTKFIWGEFTNSLVNSGSLKLAKLSLKKNKGNNVTENVSSCSLNVILAIF